MKKKMLLVLATLSLALPQLSMAGDKNLFQQSNGLVQDLPVFEKANQACFQVIQKYKQAEIDENAAEIRHLTQEVCKCTNYRWPEELYYSQSDGHINAASTCDFIERDHETNKEIIRNIK